MQIFVYGTLKRGFWNHHYLSGARYVGTGLVRGYAIYGKKTGFGIPYATRVGGDEALVWGEVYDVPESVLQDLDRLEGHPHTYKRVPCVVEGKFDDKITSTQAELYEYMGDTSQMEWLGEEFTLQVRSAVKKT
jgi:gamma-glutamylcyclotransferase (GGCT)/AIG2-like uncharacterized protein YtfP